MVGSKSDVDAFSTKVETAEAHDDGPLKALDPIGFGR
jgi:hypothetical protein